MGNSKKKQTATLKDIAERTGYSINTVSRALRDKSDIAPATREKIKSIANEMGHINNMLASSLRLGYTKTIAVILGDVSNLHFAIMMKEIEGHAREKGYSSFLINTNEDEEIEFQAIQSAINKNVDGIIICPIQKSKHNIKYLQSTGIPFVLIGRYFEEIDTNYVICNDELGGFQATTKLLNLGHREILMLHGPSYISSARERLAGYIRAHNEQGIAIKKSLIHEIPVTAIGWEEVLKKIMEEQIAFSAVFAFSDMVAWNTWSYLRSRGYQVPTDVSIIGFDHIESRIQLPFKLTSVSSYKGQMSITAVDVLLDYIQSNKYGGFKKVIIDTKLAEGSTVSKFE